MGSGLVEDHNVGSLEKQACDSDALLLTSRETIPSLADDSIQLVGQGFNKVQNLRIAQCTSDLFIRCIRLGAGV